LVWLNWGEKVYVPIASSLTLGTLTTFTAIFFTLKEFKINDAFVTSIIFDEQEHLPLFLIPQQSNMKFTSKQSDFSSLGRPTINQGKDTVISVIRPKDFNEAVIFLGELIQYKIVKEIRDSQRGGWSVQQAFGEVEGKIYTPTIPTEVIFPRICVAKERMLNHGYQTEDGIGTGKAASPEVRRGIQA
jgi:hypothetical protein